MLKSFSKCLLLGAFLIAEFSFAQKEDFNVTSDFSAGFLILKDVQKIKLGFFRSYGPVAETLYSLLGQPSRGELLNLGIEKVGPNLIIAVLVTNDEIDKLKILKHSPNANSEISFRLSDGLQYYVNETFPYGGFAYESVSSPFVKVVEKNNIPLGFEMKRTWLLKLRTNIGISAIQDLVINGKTVLMNQTFLCSNLF